ncbi:MAG TPA: hypothetical protein VEK73_11055, partial [Xanthobacteraceae bacterium]|nr:hypothetical protein [Xanthobacteraceae bacterium]
VAAVGSVNLLVHDRTLGDRARRRVIMRDARRDRRPTPLRLRLQLDLERNLDANHVPPSFFEKNMKSRLAIEKQARISAKA